MAVSKQAKTSLGGGTLECGERTGAKMVEAHGCSSGGERTVEP